MAKVKHAATVLDIQVPKKDFEIIQICIINICGLRKVDKYKKIIELILERELSENDLNLLISEIAQR